MLVIFVLVTARWVDLQDCEYIDEREEGRQLEPDYRALSDICHYNVRHQNLAKVLTPPPPCVVLICMAEMIDQAKN